MKLTIGLKTTKQPDNEKFIITTARKI